MSSLQSQLRKIALPSVISSQVDVSVAASSASAARATGRASILFDTRKAAEVDLETIYAMALNGLSELKQMSPKFAAHEQSLFSESAKDLDRTLQTPQVNAALDEKLADFLRDLSPYIMLKPAQKTLEWLVRRFRINEFNMSELVAAALPYHDTHLFVRVVSILPLKSKAALDALRARFAGSAAPTKPRGVTVLPDWSWLRVVQQGSHSLDRSALVQRCMVDPALFTFIAQSVQEAISHSDSANPPRALISFFAATACSLIESSERVTDDLVLLITPHVLEGLRNTQQPELRTACFMVVSQLSLAAHWTTALTASVAVAVAKTPLIPGTSAAAKASLSHDALRCILAVLQSQQALDTLPAKAVACFLDYPFFAKDLADIGSRFSTRRFSDLVVAGLLQLVAASVAADQSAHASPSAQFTRAAALVASLLEDVPLSDEAAALLSRQLLGIVVEHAKKTGLLATPANDAHLGALQALLVAADRRYSSVLDTAISNTLAALKSSPASSSPASALKIQQWLASFVSNSFSGLRHMLIPEASTTLFLSLESHNEQIRSVATKQLLAHVSTSASRLDADFVAQALRARLHDECLPVVKDVLGLHGTLVDLVPPTELFAALTGLVDKAVHSTNGNAANWRQILPSSLSLLLGPFLAKHRAMEEKVALLVLPLLAPSRATLFASAALLSAAADNAASLRAVENPVLHGALAASGKCLSELRALENSHTSAKEPLAVDAKLARLAVAIAECVAQSLLLSSSSSPHQGGSSEGNAHTVPPKKLQKQQQSAKPTTAAIADSGLHQAALNLLITAVTLPNPAASESGNSPATVKEWLFDTSVSSAQQQQRIRQYLSSVAFTLCVLFHLGRHHSSKDASALLPSSFALSLSNCTGTVARLLLSADLWLQHPSFSASSSLSAASPSSATLVSPATVAAQLEKSVSELLHVMSTSGRFSSLHTALSANEKPPKTQLPQIVELVDLAVAQSLVCVPPMSFQQLASGGRGFSDEIVHNTLRLVLSSPKADALRFTTLFLIDRHASAFPVSFLAQTWTTDRVLAVAGQGEDASGTAVARALHLARSVAAAKNHDQGPLDFQRFLPHTLVALSHSLRPVRAAAIQLLETFKACIGSSGTAQVYQEASSSSHILASEKVATLLSSVLESSEEIKADASFAAQAVAPILQRDSQATTELSSHKASQKKKGTSGASLSLLAFVLQAISNDFDDLASVTCIQAKLALVRLIGTSADDAQCAKALSPLLSRLYGVLSASSAARVESDSTLVTSQEDLCIAILNTAFTPAVASLLKPWTDLSFLSIAPNVFEALAAGTEPLSSRDDATSSAFAAFALASGLAFSRVSPRIATCCLELLAKNKLFEKAPAQCQRLFLETILETVVRQGGEDVGDFARQTLVSLQVSASLFAYELGGLARAREFQASSAERRGVASDGNGGSSKRSRVDESAAGSAGTLASSAAVNDSSSADSPLSGIINRLTILVEVFQAKDNVSKFYKLVQPLFDLLSECMATETVEKLSMEYFKQLILAALTKITQLWGATKDGTPPSSSAAMAVDSEDDASTLPKDSLNEKHYRVDLIVQCIRTSNNPQTHQNALLLLAAMAGPFPEIVLQNIMPIFTFMGANVLRQDDNYSFHVIQQTVRTVIPPLVNKRAVGLVSTIENLAADTDATATATATATSTSTSTSRGAAPATTSAELMMTSSIRVVLSVARVFVSAVQHIPDHRRLRLFTHLVSTLGEERFLSTIALLLLDQRAGIAVGNTGGSSTLLLNVPTVSGSLHAVSGPAASAVPSSPLLFSPSLASSSSTRDTFDFVQSLLHQFSVGAQLSCLIQMLETITALPNEKEEAKRAPASALSTGSKGGAQGKKATSVGDETDSEALISELSCVRSSRQLRMFKQAVASAVSALLSSKPFLSNLIPLTKDKKVDLQKQFMRLVECILTFAANVGSFIGALGALGKQDNQTSAEGGRAHASKQQQPASSSTAALTIKFWKSVLSTTYDALDKVNALLSVQLFLGVAKRLISHADSTIRRKALLLLNERVTRAKADLTSDEVAQFVGMVDHLLSLITPNASSTFATVESIAQLGYDGVVNMQTALLSLDILARSFAKSHPDAFVKTVPAVVGIASSSSTASSSASVATHATFRNALNSLTASAFVCLASLGTELGVRIIPHLTQLAPLTIDRLKKVLTSHSSLAFNDSSSTILVMSCLSSLQMLCSRIPQFLSPYLGSIIEVLVHPRVSAPASGSEQTTCSRIVTKNSELISIFCKSIPSRVLVPALVQSATELLSSSAMVASLQAVCTMLATSIAALSKDDVANHFKTLTKFFISALDYRCAALTATSATLSGRVSRKTVAATENAILASLTSLIMKLSETSFRPFFARISAWAVQPISQTNNNAQAILRRVTFYRLLDTLVDKLRNLFVPYFAGVWNDIVSILDNRFFSNTTVEVDIMEESSDDDEGGNSKATAAKRNFEDVDTQDQAELLLNALLALNKCFLYDNDKFVDKDRFDAILIPLVRQLSNTAIGSAEDFQARTANVVVPAIGQLAVALNNDAFWKPLNYQVMLQSRSDSPMVRFATLRAIQEFYNRLGEEFLILLPETIPFLAELMEDDSVEVEKLCQEVIATIESHLGESLQKYF